MQIRRRRRKKIPVADRQPLARPQAPNEVWSADFVFDRTAEGRVVKCLTIVDDATTEAVAIVPRRALGGLPVTRVFDRLAHERGLPRILRTDNGPEFCGRAMLTWAHERGVTLRLIDPGKPNQNAFRKRQQGTDVGLVSLQKKGPDLQRVEQPHPAGDFFVDPRSVHLTSQEDDR